jgi:3-oxoacyl-[acyl-carrier protein] reductase
VKTAWVTGGTRGIGHAVVETLLARGWQVAFTWRSDEASAREVEEAHDGQARSFAMDLGDPAAPGEVVRAIEEAMGPIDGLVNNAGFQHSELLAMTRDEDWQQVLDVNLGGTFRCCRAVLKGMVARHGGAIVNVASLSALHGVSGQAAYGAAKAGMLGMTRALAREVGRRDIRVNAVVPGFVSTDLTSDLPAEVVRELRSGEALPRGTAPADVAAAIAFLLSEDARAITGQALIVDAGTSC